MNKLTEKGLLFKISSFLYYHNLNVKLLKTLIRFQTANIKLDKCHSLHLKLHEVQVTTLTQRRITLKWMQYASLLATCYSVQKKPDKKSGKISVLLLCINGQFLISNRGYIQYAAHSKQIDYTGYVKIRWNYLLKCELRNNTLKIIHSNQVSVKHVIHTGTNQVDGGTMANVGKSIVECCHVITLVLSTLIFKEQFKCLMNHLKRYKFNVHWCKSFHFRR